MDPMGFTTASTRSNRLGEDPPESPQKFHALFSETMFWNDLEDTPEPRKKTLRDPYNG